MSIQNNVIGPLSAEGVADPYGALRNFEVSKKTRSWSFFRGIFREKIVSMECMSL